MVGLPDFRSHSKSRPFANQPLFDHCKSRLVWISDPHCILVFTIWIPSKSGFRIHTVFIFLHRVPVGEDNLQNVEMCRHIAKSFNARFGKAFPVPVPILTGNNTARVRSLRDPTKKMSKSDPDQKSCIYINDSPGNGKQSTVMI